MKTILLKCRQCRKMLLDSSTCPILTGHNLMLSGETIYHTSSDVDCKDVVDALYLEEHGFPEWISSIVNEANWQKGKVKCPHCSARLGSFDFVSGRRCKCKKFILPPVHLVKGKVDHQAIETKT